MSIIFGKWRQDGPKVTKDDLEFLAKHTRRFASDGECFQTGEDIGMGVQAHYTHLRSRLEGKPMSDLKGDLLVFDGRLDNYMDIHDELNLHDPNVTDSGIILQAYQQWGQDCFRRLIGDWALVLWDPELRRLYLARDHAGTKTLYYAKDGLGDVTWSTYLDSFLSTDKLGMPDSIYMAAYLTMLPCYTRSPYRDIRSVPPGHVLIMTAQAISLRQIWSPLAGEGASQMSDRDYELRFLDLFAQAVARRTESGNQVIAQLSGGMDSTSIVCISDHLRRAKNSSPELLDTVSYFDDSEPAWNEKPYFTLVEKVRGKRGIHIDSAAYRDSFDKPAVHGASYLFPGIDSASIRRDEEFRAKTGSDTYRAILSGIGGDELTGGTPNSAAALVDYLAVGDFSTATRHVIAWCLAERICLLDACTRSVSFVRNQLGSEAGCRTWHSIPWLTLKTSKLCHEAIQELPLAAYRPFVSRPSAVDACNSWWYMLRTLPHLKPSEVYRHEYLYPFLDRNLVDFLLRLPQNQLSKPGRRRTMMRRALVDIVPRDILERKRKTFLLRTPLAEFASLAPRIRTLINDSALVEAGYIDRERFQQALAETLSYRDLRWWPAILRTIALETWLIAATRRESVRLKTQDPGVDLRAVTPEQVPVQLFLQ